jgi:membrane AbrB-like protein
LSAPQTSSTARLGHLAETLAIAAVGGLTVGLLGVPGGYLSGAILSVAAAALARRPMFVPTPLTRVIFVVIGISLGAVATPETLQGVVTYPASISVLVIAMAIVGVASAWYLKIVHRWNLLSAYLASAPGGLSQVMALAAEMGADLRGIAIVQTIRVVIIAVGLPAGLSLFGLVAPSTRGVGGAFDIAMLDELAILVGVSTAAAIFLYRIRFPGGLLFGAMLTSAILHGSGLVQVAMPWWVANAAMIALGAVTGSRFANTPLRLVVDFVAAAFGSFLVAVAIGAVFAAGLISAMSLRVPEVLISFAPGAVDAMMLLALALHLDPVYVGAHHLARIFFVSVTLPLVARRIARKPKPPADTPPRPQPPFQD